jgi:O-antigen/teichoic acid export membrane protein
VPNVADSERVDGEILAAAKGGGAVFGGRLFVWATRFIIAFVLARVLGAEGYGLYTLAFTVATLISAFAALGLDSAIVRYAAVYNGRDDGPRVRGTLEVGVLVPVAVALALSVALFVLAEPIAVSVLRQPEFTRVAWAVALLVPLMVVNAQLAASLQGLRRIHLAVLAEQIGQPTSRLMLIGLLALVGLTAETALVAAVLATLVATALLLVQLRRSLGAVEAVGPAVREPGQMLRFSLPVYFSNVVNAIGGNLQAIMLGTLSSLSAVGVFGIANHVNLLGSMFHAAVVSSSMPLFADLHDRADTAGVRRLYRTTSKWTLALNLPFFVVVLLFAPGLLAIFGAEFQAGSEALVILAFASLVNAGTGTSGAMLDMAGYTMLKLLNSTMAVGLAIGLNVLLIPTLGVSGAAIAVLGSTATVNLLRLAEAAYLLRVVPYDRSFAKPVLAAAAAGAAGALVALTLDPGLPVLRLALGGPLVLAVYLLALRLLGLSEEDRAVLDRVGARLTRRSRRSRTRRTRVATHGERAR